MADGKKGKHVRLRPLVALGLPLLLLAAACSGSSSNNASTSSNGGGSAKTGT